MGEEYLAISALQHYAFCSRQFALIHVEQAWEENRFTAEGRILHERVDSGLTEQRKGIRYERGVLLRSERYLVVGKMDLLEIEPGKTPRYLPVEYKRGKRKAEDWDRIQLCAQALCIEEMRGVDVMEGALWYWETRKRESVTIGDSLRQKTIDMINSAHELLTTGVTPPPTERQKRCRACSLFDLCNPNAVRNDHSGSYINGLFTQ